MNGTLAPGVYFEPPTPQRAIGGLIRTDIAAFLGYARRGPAGLPVRLNSWREFLAVFGEPYSVGHLAPGVKGFFDNEGATCYVVRITDSTAAAAELSLNSLVTSGAEQFAYRWKFSASFLLSSGTRASPGAAVPEGALLSESNEASGQLPKRTPNPGQWGNQLALSLWRRGLVNTWTVPGVLEQGYATRVENIAGLAAGSIVELYQEQGSGGAPVTRTAVVERLDRLRQMIFWKQSLAEMGLELSRPVRMESIEFSLRVHLDNRVVESFTGLSVHSDHPRFLGRVLREESLYLQLEVLSPDAGEPMETPYSNPEYWPREISSMPLSGGTDGLTGIETEHYLTALDLLRNVDDVGLLAAPDLVLQPETSELWPPVPPVPARDCSILEVIPKGVLLGRVLWVPEGPGAAPGEAGALAGVTVTDAVRARQVKTDRDGLFRLENIDTGLVTLRFEKKGFLTEEKLTLVQETLTAEPVDFFLAPVLLPPAFTEEEIWQVQSAMAAQGESGLYRFALFDPPSSQMQMEDIRGWRQKLGDTAYAALIFPWIGISAGAESRNLSSTSTESLRWIPPSGHVAGIVARTDLGEGVHRAPANVPLRGVERLAMEIDATQHGLLNVEGINCIRSLAGRGMRLLGARTLSSMAEWRYINVRRLVSALEKTLEKSLQWAVFEPNNVLLRQAVTYNIGAFLQRLWRRGALAGEKPEAAYAVKCDEDNNPPNIRDAGRLLAEVAVAPTVPFEFIIFRLGKTMEAIEVTE